MRFFYLPLFFVFLFFKLQTFLPFNFDDWSWWWIWSPIWLGLVLDILLALLTQMWQFWWTAIIKHHFD